MNTLDFLNEYALIRRGQHSGWTGDHTLNSEAFCRRVCNDMPEQATALALDIERNLTDCSDETGLSPNGLRLVIHFLRGGT